jgi:hypothetical protein
MTRKVEGELGRILVPVRRNERRLVLTRTALSTAAARPDQPCARAVGSRLAGSGNTGITDCRYSTAVKRKPIPRPMRRVRAETPANRVVPSRMATGTHASAGQLASTRLRKAL